MRRLTYLLAAVLAVMMLLALGPGHARAAAKKSLPQVPVTYPGDTDETIIRRAQWIEGAKKEGALVWWGVLDPAAKHKLIVEFNKMYPFIKVTHWRGPGEEIAAKLEAEHIGRRYTVDVIVGGEPYNYPRWRKMGMMDKFTDIIPKIEIIDKKAYSKYGDWVQPGNSAITPQYNTKLVSAAEAPKSWDDLLDPKWKGQIGLTTDMKAWTILALEEGGWGIEKTEDFLKKLKEQQLIWQRGHAVVHSMLITGEFKIVAEDYNFHIMQSHEKGAPVEWSRVKPASIIGPAFTLQKSAPHPNAARLFLEWIFSPQGLVAYEKITYYGTASPGSGTRMSKALEGLPLVYQTEEGDMKTIEMDLMNKFATILGVTRK